MENKILSDYLINGRLDVDKIIDDFYGYVYIVLKNSINTILNDEDMEEMIADIFVAIWKNSDSLEKSIKIKPYLIGIIKNVVKNKYRNAHINFSITDYEEVLPSNVNIDEIVEENEKEKIIEEALKDLKDEEYKIFIMFYYEAKKIKEIANTLDCSNEKVKIILHRVRKKLKKKLEDGGYSYGK